MYLIVIVLTYILAVIALLMVFKKAAYSNLIISLILAFLWFWLGIVFGVLVFSSYLLGIFYTIHGIILLYFGVINDTISITWKPTNRHYIGLAIIIFGLVINPIIGVFQGRVFPGYPIFGIAPCPVTLFTIGLLLWSDVKPSFPLLIIPIIWSFMGIFAVLFFEVYADIGLILAGIIAIYYHVKWPAE